MQQVLFQRDFAWTATHEFHFSSDFSIGVVSYKVLTNSSLSINNFFSVYSPWRDNACLLEVYLASEPELSLLFILGYCRSVRCQDKPTSCQENVRFGCSAGMCKNLIVIIGQRTGLGFERSGFELCVDLHPEQLRVGSHPGLSLFCFDALYYCSRKLKINLSRPSGILLVFTSSSHWLTGIFPLFCLVGVFNWFWFWRYSIKLRFIQLTSAWARTSWSTRLSLSFYLPQLR